MSGTYDGGGGPIGHVTSSPCAAMSGIYDGRGCQADHVTRSLGAAIICLGHMQAEKVQVVM